MTGALPFQRALFRKQRQAIQDAVGRGSCELRGYEHAYLRATRVPVRAVSWRQVGAAVRAADVVYVGDYHTLPEAQRVFLRLVRQALIARRRVVLALEFFEGRHQALVDACVAGSIPSEELFARTRQSAAAWPSLRAVLDLARQRGIKLLGIDLHARGARGLARRDAYAARRIARVAREPDRPLVLALIGQLHVVRSRLPRRVEEALGRACARGHLVVYQNCEEVWWRLSDCSAGKSLRAVSLGKGALCLLHTSPLECQQSFLDHLFLGAGDRVLTGALPREFRRLARTIGRHARVPVRRALAQLTVGTHADLLSVERLLRDSAQLGSRDAAQVRQHILALESCYVPRARIAWLASRSLTHVGEEAAHFVRHCAVGNALDAPRRMADAFYARCLEEAVAFLGSRLVHPDRPATSLAEWARIFRRGHAEERVTAAFVLAHKAAEAEGGNDGAALLPLGRPAVFHAVTHALGYFLGDQLHRAWQCGRLTPDALARLFRDPFEEPRHSYLALCRQYEVAGSASTKRRERNAP